MKTLIGVEAKTLQYVRTAQRPRAWSVPSRKPSPRYSYFFKGRCGKRAGRSALDGSKLLRGLVFNLQPRETGYVTAAQMEVVWRAARRRTRRFAINLRRTPASSRLQSTADHISTQRKKGGRMGSGKSPSSGLLKGALAAGSSFFLAAEFRKRPMRGFLPLRSALKKISVRSAVKYVF